MPKQFTRTIEDFVCGNCGFSVVGDGYTNHCPKCLFSKHVDVNPGDRASTCGGLMEPTAPTIKNKEQRILHKCRVCGFERYNRVDEKDSFDTLLAISRNRSV